MNRRTLAGVPLVVALGVMDLGGGAIPTTHSPGIYVAPWWLR
jgi:hypothetical protein